jgi:hypothetical protein
MGACEKFEEEKLILGVIYHEKSVLDRALQILTEKFGEIDDRCEEFSFSKEFSDYYDEELGGEGRRIIFSFEKTVSPDTLSEIKRYTNELEIELSPERMRVINLDPGLISHGRVMLATTKKTGFRIPLSDGIYTELTLFYARGAWQKLPWTYRDYQSERVQSFLTRVRRKYLNQRKENLK